MSCVAGVSSVSVPPGPDTGLHCSCVVSLSDESSPVASPRHRLAAPRPRPGRARRVIKTALLLLAAASEVWALTVELQHSVAERTQPGQHVGRDTSKQPRVKTLVILC